jgi:predicted enzyme related to lactoylglutathione lyase
MTSLERAKVTAAGVKLSVKDMKAVATFYESVIGLTPIKKKSRYVSYGSLSLVDSGYANELSTGLIGHAIKPGNHRVEIHVPDLDGIHRRIQESSTHTVQGIMLMPWGERVFHCVDPEGNVIEIIERR